MGLHKMRVDGLTYIPERYEWSPIKKDELIWSTIPRRTAEKIYQHYFTDFVLFGYSPNDVIRFLNNTNSYAEHPSDTLESKSRQALVDLVRDDYNGSADFICNEPDTVTKYPA